VWLASLVKQVLLPSITMRPTIAPSASPGNMETKFLKVCQPVVNRAKRDIIALAALLKRCALRVNIIYKSLGRQDQVVFNVRKVFTAPEELPEAFAALVDMVINIRNRMFRAVKPVKSVMSARV
jgi:hypothetical protein